LECIKRVRLKVSIRIFREYSRRKKLFMRRRGRREDLRESPFAVRIKKKT